MRVVLDTSALFYPRALAMLGPDRWVVVPSVVFLERARQLSRDGRMEPADLLETFEDAGWMVEPFSSHEALRAPAYALKDADWRRLARDAMVAGHLRRGDELWTANPRDFHALGVPPSRVVDVHVIR